MPLYEYQCKKCKHRFEEIRQYSDPPIKRCPKCKKGSVEKLLSAPAVQFKGTGWYVTDYARKGSGGGSSESGNKGDSGDKGDSGGKDSKDSGKSDSKSEGKSESKTESRGDTKSDTKGGGKRSSSKD